MVGGQIAQNLANLGDYVCVVAILPTDASDDHGNFKELCQLRERPNRFLQAILRIGLGKLHYARLQISEQDERVMGFDS
jgi:hypothetical protein